MNLAYVAGIFDGEGCVHFARNRKTAVYPCVFVVNTDRDLLESFVEQFGGDLNPLALRKEGWEPGWEWRLSWSKAVAFLDAIHPWLKVKTLQAETVFAWDAIRPGSGKNHTWDQDAQNLLTRRLTWLNKKGPVMEDDPILAVIETTRRS